MTVDGLARTFAIYRPAGIDEAAPLVVMLHGGGGSSVTAERFFGWDQIADAEGFVVAYPDGIGRTIQTWNTGGDCCGRSAREGVDDVAFIEAMVAWISDRIAIDPARIHATGISNGGMLDYTLACQSDLFAAIAPVSATMLNTCPDPEPISLLHIHGLQDTSVQFDGSRGEGTAHVDGPPVPQVIDTFRRANGCAEATTTTEGVVTTSISMCPDGRAVELITIADAEHGWPGALLKFNPARRQPSQALDATTVIWEFFAAHPRG